MKTILTSIIFTLCFSLISIALPHDAPKSYNVIRDFRSILCDGKWYFFGACQDKQGVYKDLFCSEDSNEFCDTCLGDDSDETKKCFKKMKTDPKNKIPNESPKGPDTRSNI